MSRTPVLEMRSIAKTFGNFHALKGVDLTVFPGEIHALMGENGAGKSTLMKILAGAYTATSGEILIDGQPYHIKGPKDALAAGISLIYQEMQLAPNLTVLAANSRAADWCSVKRWPPRLRRSSTVWVHTSTPPTW